MGDQDYDVFLSYSSADADFVRRVADVLRANGVRVWFAEYSISLEEWIHSSDAEIKQILNNAIDSSRHTFVFSSPTWHESSWCRGEYLRAWSSYGHEHVTVFRVLPCDRESEFRGVGLGILQWTEDQPFVMTMLLSRVLKRPIELPTGPSPLGKTALLTSGTSIASIACNPLQRFSLGILRGLQGSVAGAKLRMTFSFHPRRTTGTPGGYDARQLAARLDDIRKQNDCDDKVIYREYAIRAKTASIASGTDVFGLHLLSTGSEEERERNQLQGSTAFGISKISDLGDGRYALGRDYSLRLNNGAEQRVGELQILAETTVRGGDAEEAKQMLSKISPYLDLVAMSVQYHGSGHSLAVVPYVFKQIVFLSLLAVVSGFSVDRLGIAQFGGAAWLGASIVGTLLLSVIAKLLRELLTRRFLWPTFQISVRDD